MELCMHSRPSFASDYMEGAHPAILARLMETNMLKTQGYGSDPFPNQPVKKSAQPAAVRMPKYIFS